MKKRFLIWDNPKQAIIMLALVLLVIGSINVFSATYIDSATGSNDALAYFKKYWLNVGASLLFGFWPAYHFGYKRILSWSWLRELSIIGIFGMLLLLFIKRHDPGWAVNGAVRWIPLPGISLQPSEFAKVEVILLSAYVLDRMRRQNQLVSFFTHNAEFWKLIVITLIYSGFVYKQPDMGTATIIFGLTLLMLIIAGLPRRQLFLMLGSVAALGGVMALAAPYRLKRFQYWLNPWLDAAGDGYQGVQAQLAIGSGGFWGSNWDYAASRYFHLPEAHTDFAFAFFCHENGLFGALVLILIFLLLAWSFIAITRNTKDMRSFLLSAGITFLVIGQSFANIAMVCGVLPIIGVPLAFISYGGTSMLVNMFCVGLLLSVYKEEEREAELAAMSPDLRREDLRVVRGRGYRR